MSASQDYTLDLTLDITPDKFFIGVKGNTDDIVVIDRITKELRFGVSRSDVPLDANHRHIYGLIGTLKLIGGNYLVVLTGRLKVGEINGQSIYKVTGTEIIPYTKTHIHLTAMQEQHNQVYLSMLQSVLNTPSHYFSYTYDLTHSMQRLHQSSPTFLKTSEEAALLKQPRYKKGISYVDFVKMSINDRADQRFVWNRHLLREFSRFNELDKLSVALMHGFVSITNCTVNGQSFNYTIVSRRSNERAGCRLFVRGVDLEGNVANFVETEQIVEFGAMKGSFVQTRGSIPLFWQQLPSLRYKPKMKLIPTTSHFEAMQRHMEAQVFHYGKQVLVNLIDHKGNELQLERAFRDFTVLLGLPQLRYEAFDFHKECSKMRYDRVKILLDRLAPEQDEFGYFLIKSDSSVLSQQSGVFRTNCIDCLDRTNVVQSLLARRCLTKMLLRLEILKSNQKVEDIPELENLFKNVWADNADMISIQYSSTPALKTDYTRTGLRTKSGVFRDLVNSLTRYFRNNFSDGYRQDSIDLFLGNYQVQDDEGLHINSPLQKKKGWKYHTFPVVLLVAISMFWANIIWPRERQSETMLFLLFWGSMVAGTVATIFTYGDEFVDNPKLSDKRTPVE